MPHFKEKLPPKPRRTYSEIVAILDTGFPAPNFLGTAKEAAAGMRYWHAVAMRYRAELVRARHRYDGTPEEQLRIGADALVLSDELDDHAPSGVEALRMRRAASSVSTVQKSLRSSGQQ